MNGPSWFSQPFPPEGASTAEGIRNQLGRPELDLLTILVRESAQNSWDARRHDRTGPVDYRIDMWTVGPAHATVWRDLLLRDAPLNEHLPLRESLQRSIRVMAISDRRTCGLGGPTRADSTATENHDFVSFVRNIGEPRDTELGGGTYGFGKGVFYLASKPGTILIHTRCEVDGGHETRLIGCALWNSYIANDPGGKTRYTGRHWWGDTSGEVVEPLIGAEADAMAHRLGLKAFASNETGTTIVVVDPSLDELEPSEAAGYMAETITWHLWPKMLGSPEASPTMTFSVSCDGIEHPVPDPRKTRPLNLFVAAYEDLRGRGGKGLECFKPKRFLGRLGLVKRTAPAFEGTSASRMVGIENLVHHVCLMRPAELVITYHAGPKPPSEFQSYAGVFIADAAMDGVYAKAEPPTHDAWNPQSLDAPESTFIRMTFKRIQESLDGLLGLGGNVRAGSAHVALGAASTMFSSLVGGAWGTGGAPDYGKAVGERTSKTESAQNPGGGAANDRDDGRDAASGDSPFGGAGNGASGRRRPRVEYVRDPYYDDEWSEGSVLIQDFRLPAPGSHRVSVKLAVILNAAGMRESEPPIGAAMPLLVGWKDAVGNLFTLPTHVIEGGDDVWHVIVRPAPDTVTEIDITVDAVGAS